MNRSEPKLYTDKIGITEFKSVNGKKVLKLFDTDTGEIFEDSHYVVRPYKMVSPMPRFAKDEEQALDFRSAVHKDFSSKENICFGELEAIKTSHGEGILKQFLLLTKSVVVHNVMFIGREELCSILDCTLSNLNRKLNSLEKRNLLKYTSKGLNKPKTVKILLNPSYFWYGSNFERLVEWLSYWCKKGDSVLEREFSEKKACLNAGDVSFPEDYNTMYDIGVHDDKREMAGNFDFLAYGPTLSHQDLVYILYGV